MERRYFKDRYNPNKIWEVTKLKGGYYLRQYICGKQYTRGFKTSKRFITDIGIFDFQEIN